MNDAQKSESWISNIVGVFTDPVINFPGGWGDTLPDWLKEAIRLERLIENVRALKEGNMTGTDAEACAYLSTLSLTRPIHHDWQQIYLYIATKVYERHRTKESGVTMPEDVRVDTLTKGQERDLARLKDSIYGARVSARQDRDRGERRERREEEAERKAQEQPALF